MALNQQIIPPTQQSVKAGFVVYSPDSEERNIIILDEGELAAVDRSGGLKKIVFKMQPGDLVGVAALLEREPFRYNIEAQKDSVITVVSEDCMESELKRLPVWLLAVIKGLSSKTRKLKEALRKHRSTDTLRSLAEYCSHLKIKTAYPIQDILQEFHWQTRIPEATILEDLKALNRRRFIEMTKTENPTETTVRILSPLLLKLFVDYQSCQEKNVPWIPLQLTLEQKRLLVKISTLDQTISMDAPAWINFLEKDGLEIDVAQWINMQKFGWFRKQEQNSFVLNTDKIKYFLAALRFETNIRGVL